MEKQTNLPFKCHVFVCTHTRNGISKACLDGNSDTIRTTLKTEIKKLGINDQVRVSQSGCLGLCEKGPNVIIYPQKIWFSAVSTESIPEIISTIQEIIAK